MADSPVDRKWNSNRLMRDEKLPVSNRKCHSPDGRSPQRFYLPSRSPVLEVKSKFTFGTNECLPKVDKPISEEEDDDGRLVRTSSFLSNPSSNRFLQDADSLPKPLAFGRSRRMSRSLPELRDLQFVSVLPDVEEEESETSEIQGEEIVYVKPTRIPWHRKLDFLWCSACQALGLANLWRFPYYCYSNGGGSFVLPYVVFMVVCSVPFLCMELAIGQATQSGPISAFGQLCPLMKGIGVSSMMVSFWLTAYYSVLTAWTMFYVFNSFYSPPRWTRCTNMWNTDQCHDVAHPLPQSLLSTDSQGVSSSDSITANNSSLISSENGTHAGIIYTSVNISHPAEEFFHIKLLDKSNSINESGELRFELLASVLFVWILTYFALRKTDFFRGTAIYVITVLSHLLLLSIFLRTVGLEGAKDGLSLLFQPEWDKMFSPRVLLFALAQAFHSLGVVLGPSILMGSCHKQHNNLLRDTIVVTCVTLLTVLMVGCVTFSTIGHLAAKTKRPFYSVLSDDPGNVYVIYSVVIGSMPLPSCWGVLFFLMFLFFGLDSEIKLMATLISALKEAYTYYIKQRFQGHSLFLAVICGFCFFASVPYLTQAGIFFFQLTDYYIAVVATIIVALFEICTLSWIYGARNLSTCIQQMTGKTTSYFYQFSWIILTPVTILATLIYSATKTSGDVIKKDYEYPQWAHILGWVLFALTLCWIPFLAIAAYRKAPKSHIISRLRTTIQPRLRSHSEAMWEPKPVIILNGSTVTASEFPDYKLPELPTVPNAVQTYVEKHSTMRQNAETVF
ncbi:sodium- and chloride-dependent GABA transporter ine [Trichonephila clavata]|uniref:Transporter n=1 Tax=Trichonephila clavata TaxID=2740835 RepID=A0A8X6KY56_TRICU|nr:sodium- and chloride-dependent GABA transporter ine [Trichonephila clavata]